jgi:hypothetical protein
MSDLNWLRLIFWKPSASEDDDEEEPLLLLRLLYLESRLLYVLGRRLPASEPLRLLEPRLLLSTDRTSIFMSKSALCLFCHFRYQSFDA